MSSPTEPPSLILIQRLADGRVEWIPLGISPQQIPVTTEAAYTVIDRANYEAPQELIAERVGKDLVVQVQGIEVLVLDRFFTTPNVTFYPTTSIASGAGFFSGAALTPDSAASAAGEQVVWSSDTGEKTAADDDESSGESGGGSSPMLWVGLAAGGVGLLALGAGGGGGESGGGASIQSTADTVAPTITSSATAPAIAENGGAGRVVYTTTATDAGTITYSLKAGGDAAALSINATTGAVTLIANPDFEAKSSYQFTVVASDAAGNSAERAVSLAILNIVDLDEVAPKITSGATATTINENSGSNQIVYTVISTDAADINNGNTTYSLKAGGDADAFSINARTGAVMLTANPDFETKSSYHFTVVATDASHNSSEQAVSLAINDVADNVVDLTPPAIDHLALTGAVGRENGILDAGDRVSVTVTMTENTQVNTSGGTPSIELRIGDAKVDAGYVSGSGTTSLIFEYTIQRGDEDKNGISIAPNAMDRNGGSITDVAGNSADLKHGPVGNNPLFVVDTTPPTSFSLGDNSPVNFETGELMFGVAQTSSGDSSRTFRSTASDDIDIRVAGDDAPLSNVASGSEWGGSANLGSNDRVMLAGNGTDSLDPSAEAAVAQQSSAGSDAGLLQATSLAHAAPFDAGPGQTNIVSFTNMPLGLTSQGLV